MTVRQGIGLSAHGIRNFPAPVADVHAPQPGHSIEIPPPGRILKPHAVTADHHYGWTVLFVLGTTLADIINAILDPRLRGEEQ